jgi:predicted enzyme related to lactoylglutathione lyase
MDVDVLFAGVAIRSLDRALPWYQRVFGRSPDIVVHDDEVMWHVASAGWVYLVRDIERAGRGLVTLSVRDLDAFVAEAADRGAWSEPIESVGDAGRKASYADPDGNRISFIEVVAAPES